MPVLNPDMQEEEVRKICVDYNCNEMEILFILNFLGSVWIKPIEIENAKNTVKALSLQRGFLQGFAETLFANGIGFNYKTEEEQEHLHNLADNLYKGGINNILSISSAKEFLNKDVSTMSLDVVKAANLQSELHGTDFTIPIPVFSDILKRIPFIMGYFAAIQEYTHTVDENSLSEDFKKDLESGEFFTNYMLMSTERFLGELLPLELLFTTTTDKPSNEEN